MHVAFLSENVFGRTAGGVEFHMYYLALGLRRLGVRVTVVSPYADAGTSTTHRMYEGIGVISVPLGGSTTRMLDRIRSLEGAGAGIAVALARKMLPNLFSRRVEAIFEELKPDLIHQHDYLANIRLSKRLAKRWPMVWTNHLGEYLYLQRTRLGRALQRRLICHYNHIIAPSEELLPAASNAQHIANGVDTRRFYPLPESARQSARSIEGVDDSIVFLVPRRWAPTKGVLYFAQALQLLDPCLRKRAAFIFTGSGSTRYQQYSQSVRAELTALSGSTRLKIFGELTHSELLPLYQIADVVVVPSTMEATSLAALEAMACGVPVLATNVGGLPEIVLPGNTGWLVEPFNAGAIALKIAEIVRMNRTERANVGRRARAFVEQKYTWEAIARRTLAVYRRAVNERSMRALPAH